MALRPERLNGFIIAELLSIVAMNRQVRLYSRALKEIILFIFLRLTLHSFVTCKSGTGYAKKSETAIRTGGSQHLHPMFINQHGVSAESGFFRAG
jgi:hypothetical protein